MEMPSCCPKILQNHCYFSSLPSPNRSSKLQNCCSKLLRLDILLPHTFIMSWALAWKGNPLMWTKCSDDVVPKSTASGSFSDISLGNSEKQNKKHCQEHQSFRNYQQTAIRNDFNVKILNSSSNSKEEGFHFKSQSSEISPTNRYHLNTYKDLVSQTITRL